MLFLQDHGVYSIYLHSMFRTIFIDMFISSPTVGAYGIYILVYVCLLVCVSDATVIVRCYKQNIVFTCVVAVKGTGSWRISHNPLLLTELHHWSPPQILIQLTWSVLSTKDAYNTIDCSEGVD